MSALSDAQIRCASDGPAWGGLQLEAGTTHSWLVEDVMVDGHFVCLNLADEPLRFQASDGRGWTAIVMPPGSFWINPEGQPFSLRVEIPAFWAGFLVNGRFLDDVLGRHYRLTAGYGIVDDMLGHLARALICQTEQHAFGDGDGSLARSLIRSFVQAVGYRHGQAAPERSHRGGITTSQLRPLLEWIKSNLDQPITVEDMAAYVRLSVAHFAREFKRSMGTTPWGHVVQLRLQRACELLREGEAVCTIASQCGFADQAHLSRLFKQHYGVTPREFARLETAPPAMPSESLVRRHA